MNNASSNINTTKECVNKRNKQMTSQKKIDRPSDDPVVAVRSLRLSTTLSQVTQYYQKNIPDATSWLDVTETALLNIRAIATDCRNIAVKGSTDTYNESDRNTMITQLESLQKQIFAEGNSDYANRTVFTGYRTNNNLTFTEKEENTRYRIQQRVTIENNMEEHRYYSGTNEIPTTEASIVAPSLSPTAPGYTEINDMAVNTYYRLRMNYGELENLNSINVKYADGTAINFQYQKATDADTYPNKENDPTTGLPTTPITLNDGGYTLITYDNETEWCNSEITNTSVPANPAKPIGQKTVPDDCIIVIKETGDVIMGNGVADAFKKNNATIDVEYDKIGFDEGELRPEYYYNCTKLDDPKAVDVPVTYTKFDSDGNRIYFDIEYTIAANQTININTEACDVFNSDIQRDLTEMIDAVKNQIAAHDKKDEIERMLKESQYQSDTDQEWLNKWLDAIQKECDYFDDNVQKLFSTELGKIDTYYAKISLGITDLGCKKDSLQLTGTRVGDQRETVQELQSNNDDLDLSQIIIDYTAAYTAYQASLTAAGKLGDSTLLNYL